MLLMIDNYDSFTYNLVQHFGELKERVEVRRNDCVTLGEIEAMAPEKIVISPGPCTPREAGISVDVIRRFAGRIPILGVCLGHQAIAYAFGTPIVPAATLMHGKTSRIHHDGRTILENIGNPFEATRYHSLAVLKEELGEVFEVSAWTGSGEVMAIRHKSFPLEGVQFHPESILTKEGKKILANFIDVAGRFWKGKSIRDAIEKAVNQVDLSEAEMVRVMEAIMDGQVTPSQIAAFATALRMKGETVDEITGAARVMRQKSAEIPIRADLPLLDTCGTGGDGSATFNISTTAAFVVAAGGVKVAKHGNRSVSSLCGSADVLEKLGVNIAATPHEVARSIEEIGIGFLFAPLFHGSMKHAAVPRREVGIRTIFNVLGPLTNPAGARYQLVGVYREELCETLAAVLLRLGTERALVVHGLDCLDEISVSAKTRVAEVRDGKVAGYTIDPASYGFSLYERYELAGGDAAENARITEGILDGSIEGARRAAVLLNAGAAFYVAGAFDTIAGGISFARQVIDSGRALKKLQELREVGQR
jgi:anthranilate synthase/phosphoribosyltransferase